MPRDVAVQFLLKSSGLTFEEQQHTAELLREAAAQAKAYLAARGCVLAVEEEDERRVVRGRP